MANKIQAKTAIDNAVTSARADIDNILPVGVDIRDGKIDFAPIRFTWTLNAINSATADSWLATIQTNLTNAGRTFTIDKWRRQADGMSEKTYRIVTNLTIYFIVNF